MWVSGKYPTIPLTYLVHNHRSECIDDSYLLRGCRSCGAKLPRHQEFRRRKRRHASPKSRATRYRLARVGDHRRETKVREVGVRGLSLDTRTFTRTAPNRETPRCFLHITLTGRLEVCVGGPAELVNPKTVRRVG